MKPTSRKIRSLRREHRELLLISAVTSARAVSVVLEHEKRHELIRQKIRRGRRRVR
jgi:hypothetical protein